MNYGKALSIYKQDEKAVNILLEAKKYLNTTIIETALGDAYRNLKQYDKAETAYKHAANMIPIRFYPLYLLAKLYEESEQKEKAIAMAKKILEKEVKIPSTAIKEIKQEMKNIITNNELFN
jgi:tetratricopeptide (TPR) repeat protein